MTRGSNDKGSTGAFGPYKNPVENFEQLAPCVRRFLQGLDEEDCAICDEILTNYKRAKIISWFFKWTIVTMAALFIAAAGLGDSVAKIFSWFKGG